MSRSSAYQQQPPHLALARRLSSSPRLFGATECGAVAFQRPQYLYARQRRSSGTLAFVAGDGSSSSAPVKTPPPPAGYKPKVWAYYRSRSKIIEWYLQEMGVAYDAVQIDMGVMGHKDPEFIRDVNPFGKHAWGGGEVGERKVSILGLVDPQFASGLIAAPRLGFQFRQHSVVFILPRQFTKNLTKGSFPRILISLHFPRAPLKKGKLPVITMANGTPLMESGAQLLYLADVFDPYVSTAEERGVASQWTHFANASLGPSIFMKEQRETGVMDKLVAVLDQELASKPYLQGERFSVSDVAVGSYLSYIPVFFPGQISLEPYKHLQAYIGRVTGRPAFKNTVGAPPPSTA